MEGLRKSTAERLNDRRNTLRKMSTDSVSTNVESLDLFRDEFKRYKRRRPPPDLSEVIDFSKSGRFSDQIEEFSLSQPSGYTDVPGGLTDVTTWRAYRLKSNPGFLFISNPFKEGAQRYWVRRCLRDFPVKPNHTNLDIHIKLTESDNIWENKELERSNPFPKGSLLSHLRWATLGYHYEWNNRVYFEDKVSEFPADLSHMTEYVAAALGYPEFSPESGIVNFYHMESNLCAHTDHSEYDKRAPLISYSFGQSAVFLIGGTTKATRPTALYLRSGDICVMMEEARLSYHAVPLILAAEPSRFAFSFQQTTCSDNGHTGYQANHSIITQKQDQVSKDGDARILLDFDIKQKSDMDSIHEGKDICETEKTDSWGRYEDYIKCARVNVNVRQVLQKGQTFPKSLPSSTADS